MKQPVELLLHGNSAAEWIASLAPAMTRLHLGTFRCSHHLRAQPNFLNAIKLFLPVQPLRQKYSASHGTQISGLCGPSRPTEGRIAIVTVVGSEMRWTPMVPLTNGTKADGEVVWS
jgi:hypothetical protein